MAKNELKLLTLSADQEKKFFEMLDHCSTQQSIGKYEKKTQPNGIIKGTDYHWFQLIFDYMLNLIFDRMVWRKQNITGRGIEMMMEHPVDIMYSHFKQVSALKRDTSHSGVFEPTSLTTTQSTWFLQIFDYCQSVKEGFPEGFVATITDNFITDTKLHWFQFTYEYMMHIILADQWKWKDNMCKETFGHMSTHPIDYLFEKFNRVVQKVSFYDNLENDWVVENQAREDRRIIREKERKEKEKLERQATEK